MRMLRKLCALALAILLAAASLAFAEAAECQPVQTGIAEIK